MTRPRQFGSRKGFTILELVTSGIALSVFIVSAVGFVCRLREWQNERRPGFLDTRSESEGKPCEPLPQQPIILTANLP